MDFLEFGFIKVGEWKSDSHRNSGIRYFLNQAVDERVIYAFAGERGPEYIGICESSSTTLKNRMNRYQSMTAGGTNKRIAMLIAKTLNEGKAVRIYVLKPEATIRFHGIVVDLVKGLENPLIQLLKPAWNIKS